MAKRRAENQIINNLIPDHKKSRIDRIYLSTKGLQHIVGKRLTRATTLI
jgi:hypothetical protein